MAYVVGMGGWQVGGPGGEGGRSFGVCVVIQSAEHGVSCCKLFEKWKFFVFYKHLLTVCAHIMDVC